MSIVSDLLEVSIDYKEQQASPEDDSFTYFIHQCQSRVIILW